MSAETFTRTAGADEKEGAERFKEGGKFIARRLALDLAAETPVVTGGERLFVYRDGHYRHGESDLRNRIAAALGDEWRRNRADETLGYLRDSSPTLWGEPPRDRINVANGILDVKAARLGAHEPGFLSPIQLPVAYDPDSDCPEIDGFLSDVLDPELIPVFHELAGYLLIPDQSLQMAAMFLGEGAAGKSTALAVLSKLIGEENVSNVALHRLEENRFAPAELYGKLANVFADLDARALQASSMFKSITGGDAITGEHKHAPLFTFRPYARLLYSANEPPPTPDSSDAFHRRWLVLPFEQRFDGGKADRRMLERLTTSAELSGLLNHGLAALPGLLARGGFTRTAATAAAAERFRVDSDSVAGFLAERVELDPEARTPKPTLFPAYREWCGDNNRKPLSKQRFNRRVEALHPTLAITIIDGTENWSGLGLRGAR